MASRKKTKKKEAVTIFSTKVSDLVSKFKYVDHQLFKVSMICSANRFTLKNTIDKLVETNSGRCVFHKPESSGWMVYLSEYSEKHLVRILSLKAFW